MADTNNVRRDDYVDFSENDPFAELTRIMGHDPRAPEPSQAGVTAVPAPTLTATAAATAAPGPLMDDFAIDLEKELAGDFDFSDFDEQAPAADWREESPVSAYSHAEASAGEDVSVASLDDDFENFFAEPAVGDAAPAATYAVSEAAFRTPEGDGAPAAFDDGLEDALERELFGGEDYEGYEAEPLPVPEWTGDEAYDAAPREEPVRHEAAAYDDAADDGWTAQAEFDIDMLERELAASATQDGARAPEAIAPAHADIAPPLDPAEVDFVVNDAPETAAYPHAAHSLSLEEELSLLLAEEPAPASIPVSAPVPDPRPSADVATSATAAIASAAVYPVSTGFGSYGRANFPPAHSPAVASMPAVSRYDETAAEATPAFRQPAHEPQALWTAPDIADDLPPAQAQADDEFSGLFDDDFEFTLDDEPKAMAPGSALPEIETVEVVESVQPVVDDLDIPDIDYGAQDAAAAAPFDDLEAEFADVFGAVAPDEPAPAPAPVAAAVPDMQPYMFDDAQWQAAQSFPDSDLDYESDLERAIASSAYDEEEAQPAPRRRFILVAATVAGIALLGGLGVFGMSMFGGGSDAPALVRADSEPMKVRPENPGGATVPNQNNEVYQRVAGGANNNAPEQERLISSTEEPVDVNAREVAEEQAVLAPGIDDEAGAFKSEERIEPEAAQPSVAEETAMVTPRRVRTMVVRPDGTMVPREEIEPAAPAQPAVAEQPAAPAQPLAGVLAQPAEGAPAAETDDGPTVDTPQTVAVVPTQRAASQAPAPARPAAQPAPQPAAAQIPVQQPAAPAPVAAPVSAPAAAAPAGATGEWSMQIASQPTAEGAQSTYQDLARRYGGVLEGRGVSIVRADIEGRGTYYRVRIPASSRDEAIQLCTRYKAAGGSCFVSR